MFTDWFYRTVVGVLVSSSGLLSSISSGARRGRKKNQTNNFNSRHISDIKTAPQKCSVRLDPYSVPDLFNWSRFVVSKWGMLRWASLFQVCVTYTPGAFNPIALTNKQTMSLITTLSRFTCIKLLFNSKCWKIKNSRRERCTVGLVVIDVHIIRLSLAICISINVLLLWLCIQIDICITVRTEIVILLFLLFLQLFLDYLPTQHTR